MSTKIKVNKDTQEGFYSEEKSKQKRIDLNDLLKKLKEKKKKDLKSNILIIAAVIVAFIIILTILAF